MKRNYRKLSVSRLKAINARVLEADKKLFLRRIRNIIIATVLLLILVIGVGAAYTWYTGSRAIDDTQAVEAAQTNQYPTLAPTKPADDASVGVASHLFTTPVKPGGEVSVSIRTLQSATCKIILKYDKTAVSNPGLIDKVADEYGIVSWKWTMPANAQQGKWPVEITCLRNTKSGYLSKDLIVKS